MLKIADFSEFSNVIRSQFITFFTFLGTKLFNYKEEGAENLTFSCDHENHAKVAIFNILQFFYLRSDSHDLGVYLYLIWNRKTIEVKFLRLVRA